MLYRHYCSSKVSLSVFAFQVFSVEYYIMWFKPTGEKQIMIVNQIDKHTSLFCHEKSFLMLTSVVNVISHIFSFKDIKICTIAPCTLKGKEATVN